MLKYGSLTNINVDPILDDANELVKLLTAIVKTAQKNI